MKRKRVIIVTLLVAFATGVIWYMFVPTCTARIRIVKMLVHAKPSEIQRELVGTLRRIDYALASFYVENDRMPNPTELRSITYDKELVWEKYGKNRYGKERHYHYSYECGECTFVVEGIHTGAILDECFMDVYINVFKKTHVALEHEWLLTGNECSKKLDYPELILIEDFVSSSACVQTLEFLKLQRPELYRQIRTELQLEIEEGSYEEICVLSKAFREKMAKRKEKEKQAAEEQAASGVDNPASSN